MGKSIGIFLAGNFRTWSARGGRVAIMGIYVLWLVRRSINHAFPMRVGRGSIGGDVGRRFLGWSVG